MSWRLQELELSQVALWPRSAQLLLLGFVCGLVCIAGGYFFLSQPWAQWQDARHQAQTLKLDFEHKAQLAAALPAYQQQALKQKQQLAALAQQLPSQRQAAPLLDDLTALASRNGLSVSGFQWQTERAQDQLTELPLLLNLRGDYHQLGLFVAQVAALPRIVVIERLEIRRAAAPSAKEPAVSQPALLISLMATAYVYHSAEGKEADDEHVYEAEAFATDTDAADMDG